MDEHWQETRSEVCIHSICMCVYLCPFVSPGLSYRIIESVFSFYHFHRSGEYGRVRVAVFMSVLFFSHKSPSISKTHHRKSLWCCKNSLIGVCRERVCLGRSEACATQTSKHDSSHLPWFNWHGHKINQLCGDTNNYLFLLLKDTVKVFIDLKNKFVWLFVLNLST